MLWACRVAVPLRIDRPGSLRLRLKQAGQHGAHVSSFCKRTNIRYATAPTRALLGSREWRTSEPFSLL